MSAKINKGLTIICYDWIVNYATVGSRTKYLNSMLCTSFNFYKN